MIIYYQEILDGLENALHNNAVKCSGKIGTVNPFSLNKTIAENLGQPDLYYMQSVLVSTGWNENDDYFDRSETWAARNTPEDKPLNIEHKALDIVGHHTGNYLADEQFAELDKATPFEGLPDKFHIITRSVIYKMLDDENKKKQIAEIIDEIAAGRWFVSMEAFFTNFDYILTSGSENKIINRNKSTSFLTKFLRIYGGAGVYDNYRIGRLLRNITFSGSGLVLNPANPDSIILTGAKKMTDAEFNDLNKKYAETLKACETLTAKAEVLEKTNQELVKANENLKSVETEFKKLKDESERASRIVKAKDAFGVDSATAEKLVSHLLGLETDKFDAQLEAMKSILTKTSASPSPTNIVPDQDFTATVAQYKTNYGKALQDMVNALYTTEKK